MKISKRQQGFTFVELLLVLSILVVLTAVILPFSEKRLHAMSEEDALKAFMATVHETQLYAATHREHVRLRFSEGGSVYKSFRGDLSVFASGRFPEGMVKVQNTGLAELEFQPSGNMYPTGKLTIRTKNSGTKTITFQFERGRMLING
ncbi:prepilin-type N-terminal cleavage/methylation domain-containing protein [Sporosarcina sp.]|uniref:prepilin-type N-terminal cleavage/methylation domain-containing protein n=1 Tax=Sporosarcina sp. TaxID=49982 RepID=UPI0026098488|nr:prepilin-type N-terminal cleavage/methylation domain-containing protein [Sporosarcina sp.]